MRTAAFFLASLVLAAVLFMLGMSEGPGAFLYAALSNLAVVTWSSFVLPLRGLPSFDGFYRLRSWERSGRYFRWLGVPLFRRLVRRGPLALFNRALPAAWHEGDPSLIERETRAAEGGHGIAFLIVLLLALAAALRGQSERAIWLVALDIPMNLYPALLQRHHRHRLLALLEQGGLRHAPDAPGGHVPRARP